MAVVESISGLIDQGQPGKPSNPFIGSEFIVDILPERLGIRISDWPAMKIGVCKPGAVGEQIFECDGPVRGARILKRAFRRTQYPHALELRSEPGNGILKTKPAFVKQSKRQGRRNRLGHRGDAEDRVPFNGRRLLRSRTPAQTTSVESPREIS